MTMSPSACLMVWAIERVEWPTLYPMSHSVVRVLRMTSSAILEGWLFGIMNMMSMSLNGASSRRP